MTRSKLAAIAMVLALALPFAGAAEDAPGTWKWGDTTLKLYGYAQLDTTFDFLSRDPNVEGDDWATVAALTPLDSTFDAKNKKHQLYLTARTSRFGLTTTTSTAVGSLGVKLEGDFNGVNLEQGQTFTNSVLFRLRHAYGELSGSAGALLVGQTWSTFLDLPSYPDVVDFNGPGSFALVRNPMIRYTSPAFAGWTLTLAAENAPGTDGNDVSDLGGSEGITAFQTIPDFHANVATAGNWGTFSLRGVTINYKRASATPGADSYSKQAYGLAASGSFKLMGDTLVAHVEGGGGIGRYLLNTIGGERNPFDSGTDLFLWDALAYHLGYTHVWNPEWRSNLVWSQTFIKPNPAAGDISELNQRIDQVFVNTFWTFAKNASFGIEYVYGRRATFGSAFGATAKDFGRESRINASFHYNLL
jgi:hypothetical protein